MAHESFEDDEVAAVLNKDFVCIKVDREERPDIDSVYMSVAQRMNGNGGWPLTVFMTCEQKPFFTGTYFPKNSKYNMKGIIDILSIISIQWNTNKKEILNTSNKITDIIKQQENKDFKKSTLSKKLIKTTKNIYKQNYDEKYGGFSNSPKFPTPSNLMFLLRYSQLEKDEEALSMVEKTLESMYRGGIFDHIGFGFSRYSTDNKWLVPHFEKMLYDNAQLAIVYIEAYQITKNELYKTIAVKTLDYILREMTDENGGFYSAQDADSEGEEGKYYVFTPDEVESVIGKEDSLYFNDYFDITDIGNFEYKSIPNLINNKDFDKKDEKIEKLSKLIYNYRLKRTKLHKDDKILTSWNGMMIVALSKAYKAIGDKKYLDAAENAMKFINKNMIDDNYNISARYRDGSKLKNNTQDDYAFYVWAMIEIYEATYNVDYLEQAIKINEKMIELFWDNKKYGFYMTSKSDDLIYRPKETYDGVMPSGNSVAAYNLIKLGRLTGDIKLEEISQKQIKFLTDIIVDYPAGYSFAMMSMLYIMYSSKEVICILKNEQDIKKLQEIFKEKFIVNTALLIIDSTDVNRVEKFINIIKNYNLKNDKSTFYICENKVCSLPITELRELETKL